jgi:hypothetical protein
LAFAQAAALANRREVEPRRATFDVRSNIAGDTSAGDRSFDVEGDAISSLFRAKHAMLRRSTSPRDRSAALRALYDAHCAAKRALTVRRQSFKVSARERRQVETYGKRDVERRAQPS